MIAYLPKSSYQKMPWKNGQGMTAQIALGPDDAVFPKEFSWRISSAEVNGDGPFSRFEGCERLLIVTKGAGLLLNGDKLGHGEVFAFSGDIDINAELIQGPIVDLGVIYRPDKVRVEMKVLDLSKNSFLNFETGIHFIYCLHGMLQLSDFIIHAEDTVRIEKRGPINLGGLNHSVYILISIFQKSKASC
ncbi:HutD family protein [Bdellovibrio sp. SKB1291214]|uniref:HutD/Ves family protein n=1 Tax=Bdellovibrio sp. SKB1291214 TaxID=1732569 RepID=UPI000B5180D6|nr:HutD family protein [Bdellovibrio sp. SKB1291214]UYL08198.1 HutD family protein [Bdellovibrio sp. SKB1291214]